METTTAKIHHLKYVNQNLCVIFQTLFLSTVTPTFHRPKLSLGDLTSGRAFDNGCSCFDSCKAAVNDLRGKKTNCKLKNGY